MEYACYTCRKPIDSIKNYHLHNIQTHTIAELSISILKLQEFVYKDKCTLDDSLHTQSIRGIYPLGINESNEITNSTIGLDHNNLVQSIKIIGEKLDAMAVHFGEETFPVNRQDTPQVFSNSEDISDITKPGSLSLQDSYISDNKSIELGTFHHTNEQCKLLNSRKSITNKKIISCEQSEQEVEPVKVTMRSGRISKSNKCESEFVYFDVEEDNSKNHFGMNRSKHSLHSKCTAARSHKCLTSEREKTITDEVGSSKDKLLNIFGTDFDFDGWLSANEIDISIEDLDLTGFDDFEGVLPENRTLTIENLFEDLEGVGSNEFGSLAGMNSTSPLCLLEDIAAIDSSIPHIKKKEKPPKVIQTTTFDALTPTCKSTENSSSRDIKCLQKVTLNCEICGKPFRTKKTLLRHIEKIHGSISSMKFHCSTCGERFQYQKTFERHIKKHNPESRFMCEQCGKVFLYLTNLKFHQAVHEKINSYDCKHCTKTFYHKYSFNKHMKLHDSIYKCNGCQRVFANKSSYTEHTKRHISSKYLGRSTDYMCNTCGDKKTLKDISLMNKNSKNVYVICTVCKRGLYKRYLNPNKVMIGVKLKENEIESIAIVNKIVRPRKPTVTQMVMCEVCNKSLKSTSIKSHMHRKHQGSSVVCDHCSKTFKNVLSLQEHMSKLRK